MISQIKQELESEVVFNKISVNETRKFNPYIGKQWIGNAIAYGCYRKGQSPGGNNPTKDEIREDVSIMAKHWNLIRVYSADVNTEYLLEVINEKNFSIKVLLGVWIENETGNSSMKNANIEQLLQCISLVRQYEKHIVGVSVGNETQVAWSGHKMNSDVLIRYIRAIRKYTDVPVTTADDYNFWNKEESKLVASEIDFLVTHLHPLWNGKTLSNGISWLDETFRFIQEMHPGKQIVLGETGWATMYDSTKRGRDEQGTLIKGEVSVEAQEQFLINIHGWIEKNKIPTFIFEAFDESWKGGGEKSGPDDVEKHWGVFNENRTPKKSFITYLQHRKTK